MTYIQKQSSLSSPTASLHTTTVPSAPKTSTNSSTPRGSLPSDMYQPSLEFHWPPPLPVSTHTSNLRLNMMNQDPKDLHTARAIIEELRSKVRFQTEHIMKWRKAYAMQVQQHYRYQKEKTDQMNALTSQLLLLESRLKRKQKQIASLLNHRELTIQRQKNLIDTLGICTEGTNDSDSAIVLEEIDADSALTLVSHKRSNGILGNDGITIVRSISDAIETNLNKYGGANRRSNCFLRRPDILETVYSVEEDPEPTTDVAEKRDKFKNRSEKALSLSSTEGQIDNTISLTVNANNNTSSDDVSSDKIKEAKNNSASNNSKRQILLKRPSSEDCYKTYSVKIPQLQTMSTDESDVGNGASKSQVSNYNRVMSNHRSVTKPKDVKYKRINKAKSKSLEELRGRLKNMVDRGNSVDGVGMTNSVSSYAANMLHQTAQSYA